MDGIIKEVKHKKGYRKGCSMFNIVYNTDDIVIIVENENDVQRFVYNLTKPVRNVR